MWELKAAAVILGEGHLFPQGAALSLAEGAIAAAGAGRRMVAVTLGGARAFVFFLR